MLTRKPIQQQEAKTMSKLTPEQARALITPFYELFRAGKRDWDKGMACLADDWKSYDGNDTFRGKAETRKFLENFFNNIPDINVENLQFVIEGDWIAVRSELTGTAKGDFFGVPHPGRKFH